MRVFLSWSGKSSQQIAQELYDWLPMALQFVEPYMSSESIEKGTRWATNIADELGASKFGILILTPDNLTAPWIHFEAGALAKVVNEARLAPLLFGLKPSDIHAPLSQFQVTSFEKGDVWKLFQSINSTASSDEESLPSPRLEKIFEAFWPQLENKIIPILTEASKNTSASKITPERTGQEVLEEILILSRQQTQMLASTERNLGRDIAQHINLYFAELRHSGSYLDKPTAFMIDELSFRWRKHYDLFNRHFGPSINKEHEEKIRTSTAQLDGLIRSVIKTVRNNIRFRAAQKNSDAAQFLDDSTDWGRKFGDSDQNKGSDDDEIPF